MRENGDFLLLWTTQYNTNINLTLAVSFSAIKTLLRNLILILKLLLDFWYNPGILSIIPLLFAPHLFFYFIQYTSTISKYYFKNIIYFVTQTHQKINIQSERTYKHKRSNQNKVSALSSWKDLLDYLSVNI